MCLNGFLTLKNLCVDTNIMKIGQHLVKLCKNANFLAAILDFYVLNKNHVRNVMVPTIFEISILKTPYMCKIS